MKIENILRSRKLIHENKWITESKSSTDDNTKKWEVVKPRRNKKNKNNSDSESVGVTNYFQPLFVHEKEHSIEDNSSTSNDLIDFIIRNSKSKKHNIKQKGRRSLIIFILKEMYLWSILIILQQVGIIYKPDPGLDPDPQKT